MGRRPSSQSLKGRVCTRKRAVDGRAEGKEVGVNYPALTDGASRFIDTLTPGILAKYSIIAERSHPRASPLRSIGKVPPSSLGLEAQISLSAT